MFTNLGLHIHQFPSGKYGFVGSIPTTFATIVPADTSAVMGGRAWRDDTGAIVMYKFPLFDTESDAHAFAASKGFITRNSHK